MPTQNALGGGPSAKKGGVGKGWGKVSLANNRNSSGAENTGDGYPTGKLAMPMRAEGAQDKQGPCPWNLCFVHKAEGEG